MEVRGTAGGRVPVIRRLVGAAVVAASVAGGHAGAAERADLELVLLADASGSIDDAEIHFQRQGYAAAITHPEVLGAIAQGYDQRIAITYVEWGTVDSQAVVVPWTIIDGPQAPPRSPRSCSSSRGARSAATRSATRSRSARG